MKFKKTTVTVINKFNDANECLSVEVPGYSFPAPIPLVVHRPVRWTEDQDLPRPYFDKKPKYWTVTEPTSGASVTTSCPSRRQKAAEYAIERVNAHIDVIGKLILDNIIKGGRAIKRWKLNSKNECVELSDVDS